MRSSAAVLSSLSPLKLAWRRLPAAVSSAISTSATSLGLPPVDVTGLAGCVAKLERAVVHLQRLQEGYQLAYRGVRVASLDGPDMTQLALLPNATDQIVTRCGRRFCALSSIGLRIEPTSP